MITKLTLDKSNRVEIIYNRITPKIKNLVMVDTTANSMHSPAVIINPGFLNDLNLIRFQRNSQYKLFVSIDNECKVFGSNKIHLIRESINTDGYEIGLTAGKNSNELFNEIVSINNIFVNSQARYFIRWVIDTKHGQKHFDNCMEAIAKARAKNINYDLITIKSELADVDILHNMVKEARKKLGMEKAPIKLSTKFNENVIKNVSNVLYEFNIEDLI